MTNTELLIIAVGLSMDAFAVAIGKGLSVQRALPVHYLKTGAWFGGFQALMPIIGYYLGVSFADVVASFDHWVAFVLLGLIGTNMIRESRSGEACEVNPDFSVRTMLLLAIATSIDALAVGVSLAFLGVPIWGAAAVIGVTTFLLSAAGIRVGNIFGCRYKSKAELAGGVVLVVMGLKILLEHTLGK
ncbi:MAG: manganese efflux pump [Rikenellaceae bacterium]|nr:manganese efflux pump [Rikenellaceae bacterium]MBR2420431.1 manganese efflux pump [Rikenellaceae bacterium]